MATKSETVCRFVGAVVMAICLMISFSVTSTAECEDFDRDYTDSSALQFSVTIGVIAWLVSLLYILMAILGLIPSMKDRIPMVLDIDMLPMKIVIRTILFFTFTAAVASSSVDSEYERADKLCDKDACKEFCDKTLVGSFFMWMAFFATLGIVYVQDKQLLSMCCVNQTDDKLLESDPSGSSNYPPPSESESETFQHTNSSFTGGTDDEIAMAKPVEADDGPTI